MATDLEHVNECLRQRTQGKFHLPEDLNEGIKQEVKGESR